jgi:hypothetical protein
MHCVQSAVFRLLIQLTPQPYKRKTRPKPPAILSLINAKTTAFGRPRCKLK